MAEYIVVEVVLARPQGQVVRRVRLEKEKDATVMQAIERSGIMRDVPDFVLDPDRLGIFARRVGPGELLRDGDRVELYRPLTRDPRDARRRRAAGD